MRTLDSHAVYCAPSIPAQRRRGIFKRFTHYLEQSWIVYAAFRVALFLFGILPRPLASFVGALGGSAAYAVDRANVRCGLANLAMAFPANSPRQNRRILHGCYRHLGRCLMDACRFPRLTAGEILEHWILRDPEADRVMREALAEDKGVLCVSAHAGFWELTGFIFPAMGYPTVCIANRLPPLRINAVIQSIRRRLGNEIVQQEGALVSILRALKERKTCGIIMDHWGKRRSPLIPFFGKPARTVDTVARLHLRTGAPIVSSLMFREPDGRFRWRCRRITPPSVAGLPHEEQIHKILEVCNADIEAAICANPEQWTWMHNRWRNSR